MTPRELAIESHGIPTRVYVAGSGPAIVLIHGLGGIAVAWRPAWEGLADRFTVIAPDLPGHGRSGEPKGKYALNEAPSWVVGLLDALGIEEAALVGHSMGGLVAAVTALEHPGRVTGLVLEDSAGLGREVTPMLRVLSVPVLGELLVLAFRRSIPAAIKRLVYDPTTVPPDLLEALRRERPGPRQIRAWLRMLRLGVGIGGFRPEMVVLDRLPSLEMPTLVLWGRRDALFPLQHGESAAARIPNGMLRVFSDCGHLPHVERAGAFNDLVAAFLANGPSPRTSTAPENHV